MPDDFISQFKKRIGHVEPVKADDNTAMKAAIEKGAEALGIDPTDYATAMSYESGGTFHPWTKGPVTKWGQHRGTIQYGEPQRKKYGVYEGQSFEDQVTNSNVKYLKDAGVKPGMKFSDIYAAINGGSVSKNLSTPDANTGRTIADNIRNAERDHRQKVIERFGFSTGGGSLNVRAEMEKLLGGGDQPVAAKADLTRLFRKTAPSPTNPSQQPLKPLGPSSGAVPAEEPRTVLEKMYGKTPEQATQLPAAPQVKQLPGGLKPNGTNPEGRDQAINADGDHYLFDPEVKKWTPVGPSKKAIDTKGNEYELGDQTGMAGGAVRRIGPDGKPYIFHADGRIGEEGKPLTPTWILGKTKPVSELPPDPVLQSTHKIYIEKGVPDTEEFRRKIIDGYAAVKAGKQKSIFTEEDLDFFTLVENAKTTGEPIQQVRVAAKAGGKTKGLIPADPGQATFFAEVDPALTPEGEDPKKEVFRQAAKQLGTQLMGRELDRIEVEALAAEQESKKGGFVFYNDDGSAVAEPAKGKYEISGQHAADAKAFLEANKDKFDEMRFDMLAKRVETPLPMTEKEIAELGEYGITPDAIQGAFENDQRFDAARKKLNENTATVDKYVKDLVEGPAQSAPEIAQIRALHHIGAVPYSQVEKAYAREREAKATVDEALKNPEWYQYALNELPGVFTEFKDFLLHPIKSAYNKADFQGGKYGIALPMLYALWTDTPREFKTVSSEEFQKRRDRAVKDALRSKELEHGSLASYQDFMAANAGQEWNVPRQWAEFQRGIARNLAEIPKSIAALDAAIEDLKIFGIGIPAHEIVNLRTVGNVMRNFGEIVTGKEIAPENWEKKDLPVSARRMYGLGKYIQDAVGTDPYLKHTFTGEVNSALASGVTFLAGGFISGGGKNAVAALGALMQVGSTYDQLKAQGVEEGEARRWGAVIGTAAGYSERWGVGGIAERALARLGTQVGENTTKTLIRSMFDFAKATQYVARKEFKEEFYQEWGQSTFLDAAIKNIASRDPNEAKSILAFLDDLPRAAGASVKQGAIGGLSGGILGGGSHVAIQGGAAAAKKILSPKVDAQSPQIDFSGLDDLLGPEAPKTQPGETESEKSDTQSIIDQFGEYGDAPASVRGLDLGGETETTERGTRQLADEVSRTTALTRLMAATEDEVFIQGTHDGTFAGTGRLNLDTDGNVILTRFAPDMEALTRGGAVADKNELKEIAASGGQFGGIQVATSASDQWANSSFAQGLKGEIVIPIDEMIALMEEGYIQFAGLGNSEFILSPHIAAKYLDNVVKPDGATEANETESVPVTPAQANEPGLGLAEPVRPQTIDPKLQQWQDAVRSKLTPETEGILEGRDIEKMTVGQLKDVYSMIERGVQPKTPIVPPPVEPKKASPRKPKGPQTLGQHVRSMGGMSSNDYIRGEYRRISNKETGTTGLINKNSNYSVEDMAKSAWEHGYLRDVFPTAADIDANVFLDYLERDAAFGESVYAQGDYEALDDDIIKGLESTYEKEVENFSKMAQDKDIAPLLDAIEEQGEATDEQFTQLEQAFQRYGIEGGPAAVRAYIETVSERAVEETESLTTPDIPISEVAGEDAEPETLTPEEIEAQYQDDLTKTPEKPDVDEINGKIAESTAEVEAEIAAESTPIEDINALFGDLAAEAGIEPVALPEPVVEEAKEDPELAKNIAVFGPELGRDLTLFSESDFAEDFPELAAAASAVLERRDDIEAKGPDALALAADAYTAIDQYGVDKLSKRITLSGPDAGVRTLYDAIKNGDFVKVFNDFLDAIGEETEYVPDEYDGPNLTNAEVASKVAEHFRTGQSFDTINQARTFVGELLGKKIEAGTADAKMVDEVVEVGVVIRAREIAAEDATDEQKYDRMVKLLDQQPNLSVRTSTSMAEQAYSTPAPIAFIASRLARITPQTRVFEPTAGNGMLLMEANPNRAVVNEINDSRVANLEAQGFQVTQVDATAYAAPSNPFDVVIANPPFGTVKEGGTDKKFKATDKYTTNAIDHAIAFKALAGMADHGRAVLIVGGLKGLTDAERFNGYQGQAKRSFYFNLYNEYNVVDHFTVSGDLYKKQGAGWPVDVIVIEGRGKATRTLPAGDIPRVYKSWDELKEKLANARTNDDVGLDAESGAPRPDSDSDTGTGEPNAGSRSLFELLGGTPGGNGKQGTGSGGRTGVSNAGPRGQQSTRDFSDSSEHGRDPADREFGAPDADTRNAGGDTKTDAGTRQTGGTTDRGNQSGKLDSGSSELTIQDFLGNASEDTKKALKNVSKGLSALLDDDTTFGVGPAFSHEKYLKAKPLFEAAYVEFKSAVKNALDAAKLMIDYLKAEGWAIEKILELQQYITKWAYEKEAQIKEALANKKQRVERPKVNAELGETQIPYYPQSAGAPMATLLPANMYDAVTEALEKLEARVGNIDDYVAKELGYDVASGEIFNYFGGEQIDAIALAINNIAKDGALVLGDQCVAGETKIFDPVTRTETPIKDLVRAGKPITVLSLTPLGLKPVAASVPFRKGIADLYKVSFDDGRSIIVTNAHRFLSPSGWTSISEGLRAGCFLVSAEARPQKSSALSPSMSPEDALHLRHKASDFEVDYHLSPGSCDRPLRSAADNGQAFSPSPVGALGHTPDCHDKGGQDSLLERSRHRRGLGRLSRNSFSPLESRGLSSTSIRAYASGEQLLARTRRARRPFDSYSGRPHQEVAVSGRHPETSAGNSSQCGCGPISHGVADIAGHGTGSYQPEGRWLSYESQNGIADKSFSRHPHRGVDPFAFEDHTGWRQVVSIEFERHDEFFDMAVPSTGNYVAEGIVNHNTGVGKGRVVAGVLKWAIRNGKTPIFMTAKDNLYGDIYRDLEDIGISSDNIRPLMVDASKSIILRHDNHPLGKRVLTAPAVAVHNETLQGMMDAGQIDPSYNIIFSTYYALQTDNVRRLFLRQFANDNIVAMDESHYAGGTGDIPRNADGSAREGRAMVARELVANAKGVLYASATWAKRPNVMSLYSKTDMRLAVPDINDLAPAIEAGGVPLQQVVSSKLAAAGQYLRRERNFEGISYDTSVVEVDKEKTEEFGESLRSIYLFSQAVRAHVKNSPMIWEHGSALLPNPAVSATSKNFSSLMHNVIGQSLLALKIDKAADLAIEQIKAGNKPVLTFASTMGAMIEETAKLLEWKVGDTVDIDFGRVVLRYLEKARTVTVKDAAGNKEKFRLDDEMLGPELTAVHDRTKRMIERIDWSSMPASPTDHLIARFEKAGYKVGEITGRSDALQYNPDGTVLYRKRPGADRTAKGKSTTINGFNSGEIDVMLLNQSGAEGLSLHADKRFRDQRKRVMILVQAEANIDTHMQIIGRINRTNQILADGTGPQGKPANHGLPGYLQLVADIPAERRPAGILSKKMASLNANTTAAVDSAVKAKDVLDFVNMYGDRVIAEYLTDNPEVHNLLGNPLPAADGALDHTGASTKATGKLPMLSIAMQEEFYESVGAMYEAMIEQLNQLGENKLEAHTLPLDAAPISRIKIHPEQSDIDSPFAEGAYAETMEVRKLTKPRSQAEVRTILSEKLGLPEDSTMREFGIAGEKLSGEILREFSAPIQAYIESELDKLSDANLIGSARTKLDGLRHRLQNAFRAAPIGATVEVTMDSEAYYGVVVDIRRMKQKGTPLALSSYQFSVLTTDATRQLHIPANRLFTRWIPAPSGTRLAATVRQTASQPEFMGQGQIPIIEGFDYGQNVRTETRTIMTGNILAGFGQFDSGRVINFTMKEGGIRQGVLMPMNFNIETALENQPVKFKTADQMLEFLTAGERIIETTDGEARISHRNGIFTIMVPKGGRGARWHQNADITDIAGDFTTAGQWMMLRNIRHEADVLSIIDVMMGMGDVFHTNVFKPAAREIVGQDIPEAEILATPESPAYEAAVEMRAKAAERKSDFTKGEFNHTRTGDKLFAATPKERVDNAVYQAQKKVAEKHKGYYSGFTRDGAIAGFLFKSDDARAAFLDELEGDQSMMSIADESSAADREEADRRHAIRIAKNVPLEKIAAASNIARTGDRIKLNLAAMELLRRAFERADIEAGKRRFGKEETRPAFLGAFTDPINLAKAVDVLQRVAKDAKVQSPELAPIFENVAKEITDAAKIGQGTVVFYVLDNRLPEEIFHQAAFLGSGGQLLTRRHAKPDRLDRSSQIKTADETFWSKQAAYSIDTLMDVEGISLTDARDLRNAIIREETAAWIARGAWEDLGLEKGPAMEYLLDFMESFAEKVYTDSKKNGASEAEAVAAQHEALKRFEEIDYARQAIQFIKRVQSGSGDEKGPDNSGPQDPKGTPQSAGESRRLPSSFRKATLIRPEPDASEFESVKQYPGVRGRHDTASLPKTLRAKGIAADDIIYTVFSDRAAQAEAQRFIDAHGLDEAYHLLTDANSIPNPDVHHAVAAFAIQNTLQNEAVRIEATNPKESAELMGLALNLGKVVSLRMTRAGRFIRAAGVLIKNTRSVVEVATAIYQEKFGASQDLPAKIKQRVEAKANEARSAMAQHEALLAQMKALEAQIEELKKQQAGKSSYRKQTGDAPLNRRKIVQQVKVKTRPNVEAAIQHLQSLALIKSQFGVSEAGVEESVMMSIFDEPTLPADVLKSFATVGADILLDGLEAKERMTPGRFDEEMISRFGDVVVPHLESIHRESLRTRNENIAAQTKENQIKRIIAEFGDDISDEDIEAILLGKTDSLLRRNAIMRLHDLRAEKGKKIDQLTELEALIAEKAPNPAAAAAATAMIHDKPSAHELYRTLESLGYTGTEARDAIRDASEVMEKAKLIHAKQEEVRKSELRERINADDAELKELQAMVIQSRTRARESQREIDKELRRISTGEFRFYAGLANEALNTPRAIMASGDASFILRQGGWFMLARPAHQKMALSAMLNSFAERVRLKGYDTVMAEMELNPYFEMAVHAGKIDFAGLGKHGEFSITKGEEEFRNNIFGMISDWSKSAYKKVAEKEAAGDGVTAKDKAIAFGHGLNIPARFVNAWIKKSDEIYTAFLDAQRLAIFADTAQYFQEQLGLTPEDNPREFRALGAYINDATGRSDIGSSKAANILMNLPLFAPRFTVSRFKLLYKSTFGLIHTPPATRKVIMADAAQFYIITGGLVGLAWMAGLSGGVDWEDDDFFKIQLGGNHFDPFVGMQQALRPLMRLTALAVRGALSHPRPNAKLTKQVLNDQGEVIGEETYVNEVKTTLLDVEKGIPAKFIRQKLSPVFSLPIDYAFGADAIGQPFTWKHAILSRITPLGVRQVAETSMEGTALDALASTSSLFGLGYAFYPDRERAAVTDAEKLAQKINGMRLDRGVADEGKRKLDEKLNALRTRARAGEDIKADLDALVAAGEINSTNRNSVLKGGTDQYFDTAIRSMPKEALAMIRGVANEGEQVKIDELLSRRAAKAEVAQRRTEARLRAFGEKEASKPTAAKSVAEKVQKADVADSLVLYEEYAGQLTSEQREQMLKKIKTKVLNSSERRQLSKEDYDAAKRVLGDLLKLKWKEPKAKVVKPRSGVDSLESLY